MKLLLERATHSTARLSPASLPLLAVNYGHQHFVQIFWGRDDVAVDTRDNHGRTSLSYVKENKQNRIVHAFLLENNHVASE